MSSFWFEAWTLPHVSPYQRRIAQIPILSASIEDSLDRTRARGSFTVAAAYTRLSEIIYIDEDNHLNDVGSLIKVFHPEALDDNGYPAPVLAFYADRVSDEMTSEPVSTVEISGDAIYSALNHAITYPFDFPVFPSIEDDWIWGGDSVLSNGGFEEAGFANEVQRISLNGADGGTFTMTSPLVPTDIAGPLAWDVSTADMRTEIITEWSGILDVSISGSGQNTDPWIIEFTDPAGVLYPNIITVDASSLTNVGSEGAYVNRVEGGVPTDNAWTKVIQIESGRTLGNYTTWEVSDERVRTGDYAFKVAGTQFVGVQQRRQLIPGHRYNAGLFANPDLSGKEFRMVIRGTVNEDFNLIANSNWAGPGAVYTADTWNEVTTGTFIPHVADVIYRFAYVGTGSSGDFWVDDAWLSPGNAATTIGDILLQLWNDAATDHLGPRGVDGVLGWLVPTFDEDVDSNGDPWDTTRSFFVSVNDELGEVVEQLMSKWGYRFNFTYDPDDEVWNWNAYNPGGLGTDYTGDHDHAIILGKTGFVSGPLVKRSPPHTSYFATADDGVWANDFDTNLETPWGRREAGDDLGFMSEHDDLEDAVTEAQRLAIERMAGLSIKLSPLSPIVPFVHVKPGDIVPINLGTKHPWKSREVQACRVDLGANGRITDMALTLGSDVFGSIGFAAQAEAVRRLLKKIKREKKDFGGPINGGMGVVPWLVAAADSTDAWKNSAAYVCTGENDETTIQLAINELNGFVGLAPGTYFVDSVSSGSPITVVGTLQGMGGMGSARITQADSGKTTPGPLVLMSNGSVLDSIRVSTGDCSVVGLGGNGGEIRDSYLYAFDFTVGACIVSDGSRSLWIISRNMLFSNSDDPMVDLKGSGHVIANNIFNSSSLLPGVRLTNGFNSNISDNLFLRFGSS